MDLAETMRLCCVFTELWVCILFPLCKGEQSIFIANWRNNFKSLSNLWTDSFSLICPYEHNITIRLKQHQSSAKSDEKISFASFAQNITKNGLTREQKTCSKEIAQRKGYSRDNSSTHSVYWLLSSNIFWAYVTHFSNYMRLFSNYMRKYRTLNFQSVFGFLLTEIKKWYLLIDLRLSGNGSK